MADHNELNSQLVEANIKLQQDQLQFARDQMCLNIANDYNKNPDGARGTVASLLEYASMLRHWMERTHAFTEAKPTASTSKSLVGLH